MLMSLSNRHLYKGMGTNAAGIVLTSTSDEFDRLVPMAWMARGAHSGGFVTQYSKDQIEALGLVKLDALGSKTLTILDHTMRLMDMPISRISDIEYRDGPTYQLIRGGQTDGLFQLEGKSTKWGLRDLKPTAIKDVIAAMALFRPATMNTGATRAFIARKHKEQEIPKQTRADQQGHQGHPRDHVVPGAGDRRASRTRDGADDLTTFLKAVKASNKDIGDAGEVIETYQRWIHDRCMAEGMHQDDQEFLRDAIAGFAEYGFNRAHATVYGITAYRASYLAARHPLEYHTALLGVASEGESKKENRYIQTTRRRGIRVLAPEINTSSASYSIDDRRGAIRKGLQSIDGVGAISATKLAGLQPFASLDDLVERSAAASISGFKEYDGTPESLTGILGHLNNSGCLVTLIHGRKEEKNVAL